MRFATSLLYDLARSAPNGAELQPTDAALDIPTFLSPTITLIGGQRDFAGFSNSEEQTQSFMNSQALGQGASAAAATLDLCRFSIGLWLIEIIANFTSSYTQVLAASPVPEASITFGDAVGTARFMQFFAINAGVQHQRLKTLILFPKNGWRVALSLEATGVGETQALAAAIIANRML